MYDPMNKLIDKPVDKPVGQSLDLLDDPERKDSLKGKANSR